MFSVDVGGELCNGTGVAEMGSLLGLSDHFTSIFLRGFTPFRDHESVGMKIKTHGSSSFNDSQNLFPHCLLSTSTQRSSFHKQAKEGDLLYCIVHISAFGETSAHTQFQLFSFHEKGLLNSRNDNLNTELGRALETDVVFLPGLPRHAQESYFGMGALANWMVRYCPPFAFGSFEKKFLVDDELS